MRYYQFLVMCPTLVGAISVATSTTASTTPCPHERPTCSFWIEEGKPGPSIWAWQRYNYTTTFIAATVVTVVNTLRNITTHSTIFNPTPSGFKKAETNAAGTRVETIAYTIASLNKSATIASTVLYVPLAANSVG